ncbi:MAG: S8 family serine peptidase [Alphaproteobacteria bacterium]|nr:S8 family serine peptidase [Alphaproteobacteria bacterium]
MPVNTPTASGWYLTSSAHGLHVNDVWNSFTGQGIRVGIVDNGFEFTHPDLAYNYDGSRSWDALENDATPLPGSSNNHGTAIAGVIVGGNNGFGVTGVAFGATFSGYRMGFESGGGASQIANLFSRQGGVDVSNSSWAYTTAFQDNFSAEPFASAGRALEASAINGRGGLGTVFTFAAGNSRTSGDNVNYHNFGNSPYGIAVAATNESGTLWSGSNPGAALWVSAPGAGIFTTDRTGAPGYSSGDYTTVSGTSLAAPMVAGVAALMLDANPNIGYRDVQEILALTARMNDAGGGSWIFNAGEGANGGSLHFSHDYGYGLVNAHDAVRLAETWSSQQTGGNRAITGGGNSTPLSIPDGNLAGVGSGIGVAGGISVEHVSVSVNISHAQLSNLALYLVSPHGTTSTLANSPNAGGGGLNFTFTSNAYLNEQSGGVWTLIAVDKQSGATGTLNNWSIKVEGSPTTNNDVFVFTDEYAMLGSDAGRRTIWDHDGGIDVVNASAVTSGSAINLNPGVQGSIAGQGFGVGGGAIIENAIGGDGGDTIVGNGVNNHLKGMRGDDLLIGGVGADTLRGGIGVDTALFGGPASDYQIIGTGHEVRVVHVVGDQATDLVLGTEYLQFDDVKIGTGSLASAALVTPSSGPSRQDGEHPGFNETAYLSANPDVAGAVRTGAFNSGYLHYVLHGAQEGRASGGDYNESAYLARYQDVANAVHQHHFHSGYEHYVEFGFEEGRII